MISKRHLGILGEKRARRYLEDRGYEFVEANYRTRAGEIDLVMRRSGILTFVEVKTRRGHRQGHPEEAVTPRKLAHTVRAARIFCTSRGYSGPWQVDVVALDRAGVRHLPNVTAAV